MFTITTLGKITHNATELSPDVLFKELLQVHDRGIILAAEPAAALAFLGSAKITTVTTGRLAARTSKGRFF